MAEQSAKPAPNGETLVARVSAALRHDLQAGRYKAGDRLPSESDLTRSHNVSRAVVREAIAALRADGLVEARKGSGVYAIEPTITEPAPFQNLENQRISSVIELLELRLAFEVEAAALAASRRSAAQFEAIIEAHRSVGACIDHGEPTADADFAFHLAIAEATQNKRFPEFLRMVRQGIIPRKDLQGAGQSERNRHLQQEHARIVDAILESDAEAARAHMQAHLRGTLARYHLLLRARSAE